MHKEQEITKCRCWCDKGGRGVGKDAKMKQPHTVVYRIIICELSLFIFLLSAANIRTRVVHAYI